MDLLFYLLGCPPLLTDPQILTHLGTNLFTMDAYFWLISASNQWCQWWHGPFRWWECGDRGGAISETTHLQQVLLVAEFWIAGLQSSLGLGQWQRHLIHMYTIYITLGITSSDLLDPFRWVLCWAEMDLRGPPSTLAIYTQFPYLSSMIYGIMGYF